MPPTTMITLSVGLLAVGLAIAMIVLRRRGRFAWDPRAPRALEQHEAGSVRTVHFPANDGTRLEGWLFLPRTVDGARGAPIERSRAPVVVMAPGLGGTKDGFLESFAWRFVERGLAVLAFDYRCFGGSDGTPRHWVDPVRHREDYEAAIAFLRSDPTLAPFIDSTRIGLWGSSFSGGTAIVTAAHDPEIRALVVQCPYLETPPHLQPSGLSLLRFVVCATLDLLRILPPIYVPLFGRPGEWVFAPSVENPSVSDFEGPLGSPFWRALPRPPLGGWENKMLARMLASLDQFVPMRAVAAIPCPTLMVAARADDMVPLAYVERAHARLPEGARALRVFDCGHFDLYVGPAHAPNAEAQAEFLAAQLGAHA